MAKIYTLPLRPPAPATADYPSKTSAAYGRVLLAALILAWVVIVLGAYVRLSDAGLGCPDWPGCYGHLVVPDSSPASVQAYPGKPLVAAKAWKEMAHRYLAASLGLLILALAVLAWRRSEPGNRPRLPLALVALVALQGALGMWTVTLLLKPAIVTAHLLGGMSTLALLLWLALDWRRTLRPLARPMGRSGDHRLLRPAAGLVLALVLCQIALGGWTSSNYAALACGDFPTCQGSWWPADADFRHGFQVLRELGMTSQGQALSFAALSAIHWVHRLGALLLTLAVSGLVLACWREMALRRYAVGLGLALALQVALGVANVLTSLPLALAVAHNAGAALLLMAGVALNWRLALARALGQQPLSSADPKVFPLRRVG